jgi:hypothetical protein
MSSVFHFVNTVRSKFHTNRPITAPDAVIRVTLSEFKTMNHFQIYSQVLIVLLLLKVSTEI